MRLTIAATFRADLILEPIKFWRSQLGMDFEACVVPSDQVMQSLMCRESSLWTTPGGLNVFLMRLSNWPDRLPADPASHLEKNGSAIDELLELVEDCAAHAQAECIVVGCPECWEEPTEPPVSSKAFLALSGKKHSRRIRIVDGLRTAQQYQCKAIHDPSMDRVLMMPYTAEYFAALGTEFTKLLVASQIRYPKLIACDCDGTLWNGNCAELEPGELLIEDCHLALQSFLLEARSNGCTIALCSRNDSSAVQNVFRQRTDMLFRQDHVDAWKIGWNRKSESIATLAREYGYGYDSMVFIDDEKFQCEEVRMACPGVLTFMLDEAAQENARKLSASWLFKREGRTYEDEIRAAFYISDEQRKKASAAAATLEEFLEHSKLTVTIKALNEDTVERVSQLSYRVTQFNTACQKIGIAQLQQIMHSPRHVCRTVDLTDNFGIYGTVGAFILELGKPVATLQAMLLSCRALGRFVEDSMLSEAALIAQENGSSMIHVFITETRRNGIARAFLTKVGGRILEGNTGKVGLCVDGLLERRERGKRAFGFILQADTADEPAAGNPGIASADSGESSLEQKVLELTGQWKTAREIADVCYENLAGSDGLVPAEPRSDLSSIQNTLLALWRKILREEQIGIEDDVFDLGADSLTTVQILNAVNQVYDIELPLSTIFEPSVSVLSISRLCQEAIQSKTLLQPL